jgi:hypothetical protein
MVLRTNSSRIRHLLYSFIPNFDKNSPPLEPISCRKFNQNQNFSIPTWSTIRVLEQINAESANWNLSIAESASGNIYNTWSHLS